jgi:hypothetical protein
VITTGSDLIKEEQGCQGQASSALSHCCREPHDDLGLHRRGPGSSWRLSSATAGYTEPTFGFKSPEEVGFSGPGRRPTYCAGVKSGKVLGCGADHKVPRTAVRQVAPSQGRSKAAELADRGVRRLLFTGSPSNSAAREQPVVVVPAGLTMTRATISFPWNVCNLWVLWRM